MSAEPEEIAVAIPDGDRELNVVALAMGTGPLALLLHGYPDTAWTWRHLLPVLAAQGYRAVAPFNRGYAPTGLAPTGRYQSGVLGVDVNHLHERLGADGDAVVIGHDWGAMGVYGATVSEPDRWRRAVACSLPIGPVSGAGFFAFEQLRRSWYTFFQLTELAELVIPADDYDFIRRLWRTWSPEYESRADVDHFVAAMQTPEHMAAALGMYRQTMNPAVGDPALDGAQAAAFGIPTVPLLYLHGDCDGAFDPLLADQVNDHLTSPGSAAHVIAGAGHFPHLERPDVVENLVVDFLHAPALAKTTPRHSSTE